MKNFKKFFCITFCILFFLCFSNVIHFIPIADYKESYSLKLSDNEITLITPENVTYTKPVDGSYPATFSFEEDNVGSEGLEINFVDQYNTFGDASTTVVSELDGHNNLLDLWDGNQLNAYTEVWNNFSSNQSNGTIEFWTQITTVAYIQRMHWVVWGDAGEAIHLALNRDAGGTLYYDDGSYHAICTLTANDWYHFKITFNASSDWHLEVRDKDLDYIGGDGNLGYEYKNSVSYMDRLRILTSSGNSAFGFHMYMDAIGYSWDPNYSVKDNLYEGLLLSFENSTQLDWIGYSLDGQANKTIRGNTTFSMPNSGLHSIQVFGSDSFFTMYQSQKIYFTIDSEAIRIFTPENKTYTRPIDGYFPGTYSFSNDEINSDPEDFITYEGGGLVDVIDNYYGHKNIVQIWDSYTGDWTGISNNFDVGQATGTIEVYVRFSNTNKHHELSIRDGGSFDLIYLGFIDGYVRYNDGGGWINTGVTFSTTTWYRVKIEFNCTTDWHLWIDSGAGYVSIDGGIGYNFFGNPSEMDTLFFGTYNTDAWYYYYIDAIGYSWDENYNVGDNIQDGLYINGYYPATYDFDDNIDGTRNLDINFIDSDSSGSGSYFETSSSFNDHNSVLKCVDGAGASGFNGIHYFDNKTSSGTIEFWYALDNDAIDNGMNIRFYTDGGHAWYLNGYKGYFRSNGWVGMGLALANTWYHIKMVFNCSLNNVDIYIDGEFEGTVDFAVPSNQIEYMAIESDSRYDTSFTGYLDAFGYSWDENYNVGDNLKEGLLLGYETNKHLDWIGYSLNNNINVTIMGDTTLSIPINGSYNVQVFANDTYGAMYKSEVRYFHYYFDANIPDIPTNVVIRDGWEHIYMSWDIPNDNNAPITRYNIYRGEIENGSKSLIDFSTINEYNDTTAVVGTMYYYYISAVNILGESENSTEVSGIAWDAPFVRWRSPGEEAVVILPTGDAVFDFVYDWGGVTDVELIIINATDDEHDFGSVFNQTSHILTLWSNSTEGPITAELRGYNDTDLVATDSRNFTLSKLVIDVYDRLDSNTTIIGNVLYLILHDPNGDNSYSSFSETTTLSMGMSSQITNSIAASVKVGAEFDLFGYSAGASLKVTAKATEETGYDYRYEVVDKTELTSSLDSTNRDYIGPGFGDRYWGEAWIYKWELNASYRVYFNGTKRYEEPKLYYGVIRDAEVILSDYNAPDKWRALNPVHNGWQNVEWAKTINHDGGAPYDHSQEVTTTEKRTHSFEIGLDTEAWAKVGIVETTLNISLNVKNYVEHSEINTYTTACEIYDDESTDIITMMSGIDLTFGTYIFNTTSFFCETSYPLERNTKDYIAPIIEFPEIDLDSNNDGIAPGSNDSPIITVDIFEEGEVQEGYIWYSINNGGNWDAAILSEQVANPGTWEKNIPAQARGTTVLWYIQVWDTALLNSTRKNPIDEPYSYTVINSVPTVSVITPNGGEDYTNTVRIEWSDYDNDNDDLSITIAYNLGGAGWHLIVTNTTGTFYDWDISSLGYSDSVLIKVIVNDGVGGETEDISDFVFAIGTPPSVPPDIPGYSPLIIMPMILIAVVIIIISFQRKIQKHRIF